MYPKISIITVNYNTTYLVNNLEREFFNYDFIEFIVVDNSQNFQSVNNHTVVVKNPENSGFGMACNLGVNFSTSDLIMLLNPDVKIKISEINKLIELSSVNKNNIFGPIVSSLNDKYSTLVRTRFKFFPFLRKSFKKNRDNKSEVSTFISGACMLFYKDRFLSLGAFHSDIFLYGEDLDLCIRNSEYGGYNIVYNNIMVEHIGGVSSSDSDNKKTLITKLRRLRFSYIGHYNLFRRRHGVIISCLNAFYLASGYSFD